MATQAVRFTKQALDAVQPPAPGTPRVTLRDTEVSHLHLRVTSDGRRSFYLIRKTHGKVYFRKLGDFPDFTVYQARQACMDEGSALARGEDRLKARTTMTFGELFDRYIEDHAKPHKKTWQEDVRKFNTLLTAWKSRQVGELDRDMVVRLHKALGADHGHYLANRTLALVRGVLYFGINQLGLRIKNPCANVTPFKEMSRERFLRADELRRFSAALDAEPNPDWADFFRLALWTAARRANVQAMRWEDIDLLGAVWRIPGETFKNGDPFTAVLSAPALEILNRRKREQAGTSPYVFPANSKAGHIVEPRKAWDKVLTRAGLSGVRVHDLRRTMGSWQALTGASLAVIGKSLGHKDLETTAVYARMDLEPVRESVDRATTAMLKATAELPQEGTK